MPDWSYSRCADCSNVHRQVMPDGPTSATTMLIGEGPGFHEDKFGTPFIGRSGQELNETYLPLAGLDRADVFVTNVVQCLGHATLIKMADGTSRRLIDLVKTRSQEEVMAYSEDSGRMVPSKILDWFRSELAERELYSLRFAHHKPKGSKGPGGVHITEDHRVLTERGWIRVDCLETWDRICTGTPGLSRDQISAVLGMVLGDGHITKHRILTVTHSLAQVEYTQFKQQLLGNLNPKKINPIDRLVGFRTPSLPVLGWVSTGASNSHIDETFAARYFNEFTLAVWFMDDGYRRAERILSKYRAWRSNSEICSPKLKEHLPFIVGLLADRFGLESRISQGYRIQFGVNATKKLGSIIAKYVPPTMEYKIDPEYRGRFEPNLYKPAFEPFFDEYVLKHQKPTSHKVYCLETTEGNFATIGAGVVHNCRAERNGVDVRPSEQLSTTCAANHLPEEIWTVNPTTIILCGATACSLLTGSDKVELEFDHGFPRQVNNCAGLWGWSGTVVPMYHPAAGLRESRFMISALEDFGRLGKWFHGKWDRPVWPTAKQPRYEFLHGEIGNLSNHQIALDTESDNDRLWSIQWSAYPGMASMILADDHRAIGKFQAFMADEDEAPIVVMHNAGHDLQMLAQIGIRPKRIRDTMQEIYHLAGVLPQGLKAAVYRVTGHRMMSYDDVVTPYSKAALEDWLAEALTATWQWTTTVPHPVGKNCPTCGKTHRKDVSVFKQHEAAAVVRRIFSKVQEADSTYDPWQKPKLDKGEEKPRLVGREWLPALERLVGANMPRKSIVHAPLDKAVQYACSDSDWTLRLAMWLEGERKRIVREEWNVA